MKASLLITFHASGSLARSLGAFQESDATFADLPRRDHFTSGSLGPFVAALTRYRECVRACVIGMEVGDRVQERGGEEQGSLRWRGTLEGTEGEWLGIEWDSRERGKHRGEYKGEQVFQCRWEDSSGSFVRPSKVRGGRCFAPAVREKYSPEEQSDATEAYVLTESDQKVCFIHCCT